MLEFELIKQIHILRPEWLLALIPYFIILYKKYHSTKKDNTSGNTMPLHLKEALSTNEKSWKSQLPLKLLSLLIFLAIIISAGISWKKVESPFEEDKSSLIIVLDVSESMLETDLQPSRLERSKQKIQDLLEKRSSGKTSLIAYSGSAHSVMPETEDIEIFKPLLNALNPKIMPRDGKFAELAIPLIEKITNKEDSVSTILLITDGLGNETESFYKSYSENNVSQIIIYGAGNPNGISNINFEEQKLKNMSNSVNGNYKRMTVDDSDINYIISKIDSHLQLNSDNALPWDDASYYLVFIMAFFYLFWFRKGWLVQWCFVGAVSISALTPQPVMASEIEKGYNNIFIDIWMTKDQQGRLAFENEEYKKAGFLFEDPMWKGVAYYMDNDYKKSHTYFMRVNTVESKILAANSLARSREYVAARSLYNTIIKEYPENEMAKHNRDEIQKIIDQINQFSESQANGMEKEFSNEMKEDTPQTSEGAEEEVSLDEMEKEILTANELIENKDLNDKWLKRVQSDPSKFLSTKFYMQLNRQEEDK